MDLLNMKNSAQMHEFLKDTNRYFYLSVQRFLICKLGVW